MAVFQLILMLVHLSPHLSGIIKQKSTGVQNMHSGTKLTVKDATDAKTQANSTSPRAESNGRRPGPGFGPKSGKQKFTNWFCLPEQSWVVQAHFLGLFFITYFTQIECFRTCAGTYQTTCMLLQTWGGEGWPKNPQQLIVVRTSTTPEYWKHKYKKIPWPSRFR